MRSEGQNPKLPPPLSKRCTKRQVEEAIKRHSGMTSAVVKELDTTYCQYSVYLESHNDLAKLAAKLREQLVDKAEEVIEDCLGSGDDKTRLQAAKFILQTQGKKRGWTEAEKGQEITVKDGEVSIKQIFGIKED